jgi:hypothetical protein
MVTVDTSLNITAGIFAAYLKCPTKSHLMAQGEQPPDTFVSETCGRISRAYKGRANQSLRMRLTDVAPIDFIRLTDKPGPDAATVFVDCETAFYACDQRAAARSELRRDFVPILYSPWNKSDQFDDLLVCFSALAIGRVTGSIIPSIGKSRLRR